MTEDLLSVLSELQEAVRHWPEDGHPAPVSGSVVTSAQTGFAHLYSNCPISVQVGGPDAGVDDCMVIHVVSCEEAFQQQKLDLLWQKVDDQAPHRQVGYQR